MWKSTLLTPDAFTTMFTDSPALICRLPDGSEKVIFAGPEGWTTEIVTVFVVGATVLPETPLTANRYVPGFFPAVDQRAPHVFGAEGVDPSLFTTDAFNSSSLPVATSFTVTFTPVNPLVLPMPSDARAMSVANHVLAHHSDGDTLDSLARRFGASRRNLERLFRNETGMSFGMWQQKARLLYSVRALAEGKSVTEAALDTGYASLSAFIAAFRRTFGYTPGRLERHPER